MKLPFLTTKKVAKGFAGKAREALHTQIINTYEKQLPLPVGPLRIYFNFYCRHKQRAELLMEALRSSSNEITYSSLQDSCLISGKSMRYEADNEVVRRHLLMIAELGAAYNCTLEGWRIEGESFNQWYGGLVIKNHHP